VCWLLIGVSFNLSGQSPLEKLESSRRLWNEHDIDDYVMTVSFGSFSYVGRFYFTIHDNQITQIDTVSNAFRRDETPFPLQGTESAEYAQSFGSYGGFPPSLNDYTMDSLFDFTAQQLATEPTMPLVALCGQADYNEFRTHSEATYNSELGYIQSFAHTNCGHGDFGAGLLCPVSSECYSGFGITDFEPLN
jgi:hypothetical protein